MWAITGQAAWLTFPLEWLRLMQTLAGNPLPRQEDKQEEDKMWCDKEFFKICYPPISLDTLPCTEGARRQQSCLEPAKVDQPVAEEKKMFDEDFEETGGLALQRETRDWFLNQLDYACSVHYEKAKDAFHINENRPSSIEDFIDKIKNDKFILTSFGKDRIFNVWDTPYYFTWRTQPEDREGFEIVRKKIERAYILAKRGIMADTWNMPAIIEKFEEMDFLPANDNLETIAIADAA